MVIDNWQKLVEIVELIKCSLPINMQIQLNDTCTPVRNTQPLPFDPRTGNWGLVHRPAPAPTEVRVSLLIDDTLGWVLPVQFSVGPLLTAAEIIQKIANACFFLESWSHAHSAEARAKLRFEYPRFKPSARSGRKAVIQ